MASPEQVTMYRCYECGALLKSYFSAECCAQLDKRKRGEACTILGQDTVSKERNNL